jgi:CBS domain-containing protein
MMSAQGIGFLPVRDDRDGGRLVGVVTDRDVALRPAEQSRPYDGTTVKDVMSSQAHAVRDKSPVEVAAAAMKAKMVRRLLVLNEDSQLVGVVSLTDIAARSSVPHLVTDVLSHIANARRKATVRAVSGE